MPHVVILRWQGVTPEQYDAVRDEVKWESDAPPGGIHHVAWFADGSLNVVDVWESQEEFDAFAESRLMPATSAVGVEGAPEVTSHETHRVYAPGYDGSTR